MKTTLGTLPQSVQILSLFSDKEMTTEKIQLVLGQGTLTDVLEAAKSGSLQNVDRDAVREALGLPRLVPKPTIIEYTVPVNYDRSVEDFMIGEYDWSDGNINSVNFPSKGNGTKDVAMATFHFGCDISSESVIGVIKEMEKAGFRPANEKELLAFGEKNPEIQRDYPIVELGEIVTIGSHRQVGCLDRSETEREARLRSFDRGLRSYYRLLAVRLPAMPAAHAGQAGN